MTGIIGPSIYAVGHIDQLAKKLRKLGPEPPPPPPPPPLITIFGFAWFSMHFRAFCIISSKAIAQSGFETQIKVCKCMKCHLIGQNHGFYSC